MTKNNLREHLSWLLKSASTNNLHSASGESLKTVALLGPSNASIPTPFIGSSAASSTLISKRNDNATSFNADPAFARPNLPTSLLRAQSRDDMARLQSGPKSSNRPKLLSESTPASLQAPTPSSVHEHRHSLAAQYNRGLSGEWRSLRCPKHRLIERRKWKG